MKHRRLNKQDKELIVEGFMRLKYDEISFWNYKDSVISAFRKQWSKRILKALYPAAVKRRMSRLPEGWLPTMGVIRLVAIPKGECRMSLEFAAPANFRALTADLNRSIDIVSDPRFDDIRDELLKEMREIDNLRGQWSKDMQQVRTCLEQFTTTKQLEGDWPEALQFIPKPKPAESKALVIAPAVINEQFITK